MEARICSGNGSRVLVCDVSGCRAWIRGELRVLVRYISGWRAWIFSGSGSRVLFATSVDAGLGSAAAVDLGP
jgi:hypothetical protein